MLIDIELDACFLLASGVPFVSGANDCCFMLIVRIFYAAVLLAGVNLLA